ncbi:MAG: hypothetical protein NWF10_08150 [Candidatus Bathyarchaeota archaeon]|nr:hypothetical protein [Candidatus Bathyarchaeota archaeon]
MNFSRSTKLWVFITIISYLVYNLWQIFNSIEGFFFTDSAPVVAVNPFILLIVILPLVGLVFRFVGSCLALYVVNLMWIKKSHNFFDLKGKISLVVLMENIFFISIVPNFFFITVLGDLVILISYFIQTFLTIPFLLVLRRKIIKNKEPTFRYDLKKWFGLTYLAYLVAIWVNHGSRWFDMALTSGISLLQTSLNPLGVFNSFVILSLSVTFAVVSFIKMKQGGALSRWFGLSLTLLGLHFIILVIFYALIDSLHVVYLFEIWTIPFFGLGLALLRRNKGTT